MNEKLRAAAQAILDSWDSGHFFTTGHADRIGSLRAVLAEQEDVEPVAWRWLYDGKPICGQGPHGGQWYAMPGPDADIIERATNSPYPRTAQYLWDGPPPRREWVSLTDWEIAAIASTPCAVAVSYVHTFARAIEQAVREKNG